MELTATQIQKYKKYTIAQLVKKAQQDFNRYIRYRDMGDDEFFKCFSCGQFKHRSQANASHYMSAGNHQVLRFNELNVWNACVQCNKFLHGNLIEYRQRLVEKIGEEQVKWLETIGKTVSKHDRYSLICVIEDYKNKIK